MKFKDFMERLEDFTAPAGTSGLGLHPLESIENALQGLVGGFSHTKKLQWVNKEAWRRLRDGIDEFHNIFSSLKLPPKKDADKGSGWMGPSVGSSVDPRGGQPLGRSWKNEQWSPEVMQQSDEMESSMSAWSRMEKVNELKMGLDRLEGATKSSYTVYKQAKHPDSEILLKLLKLHRVMEDALSDIEEKLQGDLDQTVLGDLE